MTLEGPVETKAYQFIPGRPSSRHLNHDEDKENDVPINKKELSPVKPDPNTIKQPSSPSKPFPSTPATRLPLIDLIGDTEHHHTQHTATDISPEERIKWHTALSPRSSNARTTPASRKKRPRSSSPPSTSQRGASKKSKPALDLGELKKTLRTPQIDPSADLWNRYTVNSGKEAVQGQPISMLNLIASSSPHILGDQAGNVGGLRRWTSCGVEFPSSKAKRRKTENSTRMVQLNTDSVEIPQIIDEEHSPSERPHKLGNLLERMQKSLRPDSEARADPQAPSSSSPLPDRQENFDRQSISPCRASELAVRKDKASNIPQSNANNDPVMTEPVKDGTAASSSFGSDTIESDLLQAATAAAPSVDVDHGAVTGAEDLRMSGTMDVQGTGENKTPVSRVDEDEEDDFGDNFDLSAEDLEDVTSFRQGSQSEGTDALDKVQGHMQPKSFGDGDQVSPGDEDDDDIDEELFAAAEFSATQFASSSKTGQKSSRYRKRAIQRYLIKHVQPGEYTPTQGRVCPEKIVQVEEEADKMKTTRSIVLRESWLDTRCTEGSYVHIIGDFDRCGRCIINDAQNMLILHPDHLISALVVADSFGCMRKSVLQDRIKATNASSPPMLYGTILHEIFQEAMQANCWDEEWLYDLIATIVKRHVEDLYQTGLTIDSAIQHLQSKTPELQAWAEAFVKAKPEGPPRVRDMNGKRVKMSVNKLLDVEEHIWSPMYGLKGNIDATVQVTIEDEDGERTLTVPLEIKTGKQENASHRAQTALYTLLLSDRYDVAVAYGILYYVERSETSRVPAIRHEICHMIMQRNELACYVRERLSLPPMIRNTHTCNRCYAKGPCFLYHKLSEEGSGETSGMRDKFDALTKHLTPTHQEFFKKWDDLLTKEESEMMKFRRELWTMLSHEREKLGRCFANVVLSADISSEDVGTSKINRFSYRFRKLREDSAFSFAESQIAVGEPVVVSDEKGHYALAKGYVTAVSKSFVNVAVDRRLHNARTKEADFDPENNQTFVAIMDVSTSRPAMSPSSTAGQSVHYRLDKDEYSNGMATIRNNLIEVMTADAFHSHELRSQIVDLAQPRFRPESSAFSIRGPPSQSNINTDQQNAIEKIMAAEDYALVLGMPGTGKTTTIAHIIRALVARGKSVLLTSYTHTAVDNILLKVKNDGVPVLRLGALARIHPEVKEFATLAAEPRSTVEELQAAYHDPLVVATTCLGISHPLFSQRTFDYCIVDEASQITLPVCLGPIRMARVFVLVGDHFQLPPLVQNREALKGGLDVSLFKLLSEAQPEAVATLSCQYRMNETIMHLSNELIYNGRLRCGSPTIASRRLELPFYEVIENLHPIYEQPHSHPQNPSASTAYTGVIKPQPCRGSTTSTCVLRTVLAPTTSPVTFINTDSLIPASHETCSGPRITNILEAQLTIMLVRALLVAGTAPSSIGIITLYRSQLALIKFQLSSIPDSDQVEAHTADRFQGRDKDVIIVSFVRSNEADEVGELLRDWRRVNVSITRAKRKLIMIGGRRTLERGDRLLGRLVGLCAELEGGVVELDERWGHDFGDVIAPSRASVASTAGNGGEMTSPKSKKPNSTPQQRPKQQAPSQRRSLAPLSTNAPSPTRNATSTTKKYADTIHKKHGNGDPAFKAPSRVVQGSRPTAKIGHGRPVLNDLMRDIIGHDVAELFDD